MGCVFSFNPKISVNVKNVQDNFLSICDMVDSSCKPAAVVKGNGYGLGVEKIAKALHAVGCRDFWVAYISEAADLRRYLPNSSKIFCLQGAEGSSKELMKSCEIIPVINSRQELDYVKDSGLNIVLHVDSGLSRLGIRPEELDDVLDNLGSANVLYVMSHLACAGDENNPRNLAQKQSFDNAIRDKISKKITTRYCISNSSGVFLGSGFHYDMVRIGSFLYGINSGNGIKPKNVVSMNSYIMQKYSVPKGTSVGYGVRFTTERSETKLAVVSIGYADGIPRALSNVGVVSFYSEDGRRAEGKIIGDISMDLLVCDITDIPDEFVKIHSQAFLIDDCYTVNEMARDVGTTPGEIMTGIAPRQWRVFTSYILGKSIY